MTKPSAPTRRLTDVLVAVPVRNEETLLRTCLDSVLAAVAELGGSHPDVRPHVVVALDCCTDGSADIAHAMGVTVVDCVAGTAGGARDAAIRRGLDGTDRRADRSDVWIACTDADSLVPPHWLTSQVGFADAGLDLVVGTVEPFDDGRVDPVVLQRWHGRHRLADDHPYVHGANLGLRASAWAARGGFGPVACGEDVAMVADLRAAGYRRIASDAARVQTSARLVSRVRGGFADALAAGPRPATLSPTA